MVYNKQYMRKGAMSVLEHGFDVSVAINAIIKGRLSQSTDHSEAQLVSMRRVGGKATQGMLGMA